MSSTVDTFALPRIEAGAAGQAAIDMLNAPVEAAEAALNSLSRRINNLNTKSATIRHGVPVDATVTAGMLVYYNTDTARFSPAIAKLSATPGANGASIEAPESRVEGLILRTDSDNLIATMLCGGYYEDKAVAKACLGETATAGTYYLSPVNAGMATKDTKGHMRQAVLSYYGDGKFNLNVFYMAHDNHFHGSATLSGAWLAAASSGKDNIPDGVSFIYDTESDPQFDAFGEVSQQVTAIFYEGKLQTAQSDFVLENGYIGYKGSTTPAEGSVTLFNHYPFAYNSPVIRSVESTNSALTVRNTNGRVTLVPSDFVAGDTYKNALAISAISGRNISYTPVVTSVKSGAGVSVSSNTFGEVIVSSADLINTPLDAYSVNHNGTQLTSDGTFTYFTFPKGRLCELVMSLPVRAVGNGASLDASSWVCCAGQGATFNTDTYFIKTPTASEPTPIPTTPVKSTISAAGAQGYITFAETPDTVRCDGEGLLVTRVRISAAPSDDIKLTRIGFKLSMISGGEREENSTGESVSVLTGVLESGYSATAYDIVRVSGNKLVLCTSANVEHANTCVGVALRSCSTGEHLEYIIAGIIQNTGFTFIPGEPVYIGINGQLTQADVSDTAAYVQRVGTALTSNAVQLGIEQAVIM